VPPQDAMPGGVTYNQLAGRSVERLAALSDGVFAVAMTLLVLDLHLPATNVVHSEHDLARVLLTLAPRLIVYLMSFMTLGIFWVGQQTQLNHLAQADRNLAWIHLAFLFGVAIMPFSTALMAQFIAYRLALLVYWLNIVLLGVLLYASWRYVVRAGLVKADAPSEIVCGVERRIVVAQALYAFGAALCIASPYWSIAFMILVQLNYVIAPQWGVLSRI
jgi:uncharacterized membrane protein